MPDFSTALLAGALVGCAICAAGWWRTGAVLAGERARLASEIAELRRKLSAGGRARAANLRARRDARTAELRRDLFHG